MRPFKNEKDDQRAFKRLDRGLVTLAFERIDPTIQKRENNRKNRVPPDVPRIEETLPQISYRYGAPEGYEIVMHSSFNPFLGKKGQFTKAGRFWIFINYHGAKKADCVGYIRRKGDFVTRVLNELAFLQNRIVKERPVCPHCAELMRIKQTPKTTIWYCPFHAKTRRLFFDFETIPARLRQYVYQQKRNHDYNEKVRKKKRKKQYGHVKREKKVRNGWTVNEKKKKPIIPGAIV